jgi:hypothetical protein
MNNITIRAGATAAGERATAARVKRTAGATTVGDEGADGATAAGERATAAGDEGADGAIDAADQQIDKYHIDTCNTTPEGQEEVIYFESIRQRRHTSYQRR